MKRLRLFVFFAFLFLCAAAFCQAPDGGEGEPDKIVRLSVGQRLRDAQVLLDSDGSKGLLFYGENCWQALWLSADSQKSLEKAAQKYLEQFEKRRLKRPGGRAPFKAYQSAPCVLKWGSKKEALDRFSQAKAAFGYSFAGGSPYFCIFVPPVQNESEARPQALAQSGPVFLLFNRAQLKAALLALE